MFQRNGKVYSTLTDNTGVDVIDVEASEGISATYIYGNEYKNRGWVDTVFQGSNAGGTARVEYMRWNRTAQTLDFHCPIDNTGLDVIGNLVNTGVSDARLKANIQDIDANYSDCVKNDRLNKIEFKDKKY